MKNLITAPNIFRNELLGQALQRSYNISDSYEKSWRNWLTNSSYSFIHGLDKFPNMYFSYGISEVIERFIVNKKDYKRIIVLNGEVDYYELIASYTGQSVNIIDNPLDFHFQCNDLFCISQPFSETGCLLRNLNTLLKHIKANGADIFLDMAYFGTFLGGFSIIDEVDYVAFSLSKSLGTPGLRAGAFFSKQKIKIFELRKYIGNSGTYQIYQATQLMQKHQAGILAFKYLEEYQNYGKNLIST